MANIEIGKLYEQGRAKTPNTLWSDKELAYITENGSIDLDRVQELRNKSRLEEAKSIIDELEPTQVPKENDLNLVALSKEEAIELAKKHGLEVDENLHRMTIISLVREHLKSMPEMPDSE